MAGLGSVCRLRLARSSSWPVRAAALIRSEPKSLAGLSRSVSGRIRRVRARRGCLAGEAARGADGGLADFGVRRAAAGGAGRRAATRFFGAFADLAPGFA